MKLPARVKVSPSLSEALPPTLTTGAALAIVSAAELVTVWKPSSTATVTVRLFGPSSMPSATS